MKMLATEIATAAAIITFAEIWFCIAIGNKRSRMGRHIIIEIMTCGMYLTGIFTAFQDLCVYF